MPHSKLSSYRIARPKQASERKQDLRANFHEGAQFRRVGQRRHVSRKVEEANVGFGGEGRRGKSLMILAKMPFEDHYISLFRSPLRALITNWLPVAYGMVGKLNARHFGLELPITVFQQVANRSL